MSALELDSLRWLRTPRISGYNGFGIQAGVFGIYKTYLKLGLNIVLRA